MPIRLGTSQATTAKRHPSVNPTLPAYVQLFHENGDLRECDPLPLYTVADDATSGKSQSQTLCHADQRRPHSSSNTPDSTSHASESMTSPSLDEAMETDDVDDQDVSGTSADTVYIPEEEGISTVSTSMPKTPERMHFRSETI